MKQFFVILSSETIIDNGLKGKTSVFHDNNTNATSDQILRREMEAIRVDPPILPGP